MDSGQKRTLCRLTISAGLAAVAIAMTHCVRGLPQPAGAFLKAIAYLAAVFPVLRKACHGLHARDFLDENVLVVVATMGAFAIGEQFEAVSVALLFQVGEFLQCLAVGRARKSISELLDITPEIARIKDGATTKAVAPDELAVGDIIEIRPGEKVPVDCVVTKGESSVNTSMLTGESIPTPALPGSALMGGFVNGNGLLLARVIKVFDDSAAARIVELVENASEKKAQTERFISAFARIYTPAVIVVALLLAVVPVSFGGAWQTWLYRACMFLVISCPCAMVISVPMTFFCGIGAASRHGILVKGGTVLETAARIKGIAFDKTGTLTKGKLKVAGVFPEGIPENDFRNIAASLGKASSHPISEAVTTIGTESLECIDAQEMPGTGIKGTVNGVLYGLGGERMLATFGARAAAPPDGRTAVAYLCIRGKCLGCVSLADDIKSDAKDTIRALRRIGIGKLVMLTGDRRENAEAVARQLELDEVHSSLLPADKVALMERLLTGGKFAFAGDGINDSPVLTRSDLGVAMGGIGSDAAIDAADAVLVDDRLSRIPVLIGIARRTVAIARENIILALAVKSAVLLLGAAGLANMWAAIFADVGVAILAVLNSIRAIRFDERAG